MEPVDSQPASAVVVDPAQLLADAQRDEDRARGAHDMVVGGLLLAVGIIVTAVTHGSASRHGGTYIVAYGPILVGLIKLIRGGNAFGG